MRERVESPCIKVCKLDENNICKGCHRTTEEIAEWSSATEARKIEILKFSQGRSQKHG